MRRRWGGGRWDEVEEEGEEEREERRGEMELDGGE